MNPEQTGQFERAKKLFTENKWRDAATILVDLQNEVDDNDLPSGQRGHCIIQSSISLPIKLPLRILKCFQMM